MPKDSRDPEKQPMPHGNKEDEKPCKPCPSDEGEEIPPYTQIMRTISQPQPPATPVSASSQSLMPQ